MKIKELMEILESYVGAGEGDMQVKFLVKSHDYWKTNLVADIDAVDYEYCKFSSYHDMEKIVDFDEESDNNKTHLVLRGCINF